MAILNDADLSGANLEDGNLGLANLVWANLRACVRSLWGCEPP